MLFEKQVGRLTLLVSRVVCKPDVYKQGLVARFSRFTKIQILFFVLVSMSGYEHWCFGGAITVGGGEDDWKSTLGDPTRAVDVSEA
jgi:hypothetical protein